jgi:hypothetical protein
MLSISKPIHIEIWNNKLQINHNIQIFNNQTYNIAVWYLEFYICSLFEIYVLTFGI